MTTAILVSILMTLVAASTPILLAALGELVTEKAGVLNLGVEGMMLCGAVAGFAVAFSTGSTMLGLLAAMMAGVATAMVFAVLTLSLTANQVATGLALTIFGIGASSLIGAGFVGRTITRLGPMFPAVLSEHPLLRVVFGHDIVVYLSLALVIGVSLFLRRTRPGLILRAVGENDASAHAIGYPVIAIRYAAIAFGGALAGLGGAYFSLALTPMWADGLTAGRGWIALALVVFAAWRPGRLLLGAYLFGAVMTLELQAKAAGITWLAPELLAMTPYLATVAVLTMMSLGRRAGRANAPACLGKPFSAS
ncbi:MAG: ABC transporter permease [Bosea sp. (in: a-proteobacteria)]|uniref:ABC transporter permease n=1 Tax=Bosea sp. (in: a-proteobacteria) TaxID=1871050 RepID=UPI00273402FE|nr:ABC transporter permease [Bosea sp. (in: a-proteobacteria)]MDP3602312.1 ABC transporter permease [Bosea sp. (in: a-proteobacteria)]